MRKVFKICLSIVLCVFIGISLIGCGADEDVLRIYMPDGAPALAMGKLMHDNNSLGWDDVDYTVVSSSNISNCILQKTADIAILPINLASKILKDGENYKVVATVTNGNLYIVGNSNLSSLSDLKNKVVGVIGEGNVPDLNFKYLLSSSDIGFEENESVVENKVALRYFANASELIPLLKRGDMRFGLLPEPAVSKLLSMASNYSIELDLQELWSGGSYPQAVLVVRKGLCKDSKFMENLLREMKENVGWILDNSELAVEAINNNLDDGVVASLQSSISVSAISNCNIRVVSTTESGEVERMKSYLEKIRSISSKAIGNYTDNLFYAI